MPKYLIGWLLFFAMICSGPVTYATICYNWKGTALALRQQPDAKSLPLIMIPKGAAVNTITTKDVLPLHTVILSFYGSMAPPAMGDAYDMGGTWYKLQENWVKVIYQGYTGYVPRLFLSVLPDLPIRNGKRNLEKEIPDYLKRLFGNAVSKKKTQLPVEVPEEVNYEQLYRYNNGNYYKVAASYADKDGGPGGETHTLFLKGLKKHEAILLVLKLAQYENNSSADDFKLKNYVKTESLYDRFCWWYNKNLPESEKKERNIDLDFFFNQEGGSENLSIKELKDGIVIAYSFGGC